MLSTKVQFDIEKFAETVKMSWYVLLFVIGYHYTSLKQWFTGEVPVDLTADQSDDVGV